MKTIYVRYSKRGLAEEITEWLGSTIGPEGTMYYIEPNAMLMEDIGDGMALPTRHFAVTFDNDDDATLFKLRWS